MILKESGEFATRVDCILQLSCFRRLYPCVFGMEKERQEIKQILVRRQVTAVRNHLYKMRISIKLF